MDVEIHPDMKTPSSKEQVEYYEVRPLLPATHYTVIARQKIGNSQGVWSDNSTLTLQTKPARMYDIMSVDVANNNVATSYCRERQEELI